MNWCSGNAATGDSDGDAFCDDVDLCRGDDLAGNLDGDDFCADTDCNDFDPLNACLVFDDDFESGHTGAWSIVHGGG